MTEKEMEIQTIEIDGRKIGRGYTPYIIAEMSGNHGGDIRRAFRIMEAAKAAGADALKLQTYTADTMTIDVPREEFQVTGGLWGGCHLYELYGRTYTPWEWHKPLFQKGRELDITVFSTPFDDSAVDLLEALVTPAYKVASFEIVDLPLIERVAGTGKPVILATGMANEDEIRKAVETARNAGCKAIALLHCLSAYPAPIDEFNLRNMPYIPRRFNTLAGLSDHTLGVTAAIAAVAMGAVIIEKHLTLSRKDDGSDSAFSLEPHEFEMLVSECRNAWLALGGESYEDKPCEAACKIHRRSLYVVRDIKVGERFTPENIRRIRPGLGLPPKYFKLIIGLKATRDLKRGDPLCEEMIEGFVAE